MEGNEQDTQHRISGLSTLITTLINILRREISRYKLYILVTTSFAIGIMAFNWFVVLDLAIASDMSRVLLGIGSGLITGAAAIPVSQIMRRRSKIEMLSAFQDLFSSNSDQETASLTRERLEDTVHKTIENILK